jgi:hypothetical protein
MLPLSLPKDFRHKFFVFDFVPLPFLTLGASSNQGHKVVDVDCVGFYIGQI